MAVAPEVCMEADEHIRGKASCSQGDIVSRGESMRNDPSRSTTLYLIDKA